MPPKRQVSSPTPSNQNVLPSTIVKTALIQTIIESDEFYGLPKLSSSFGCHVTNGKGYIMASKNELAEFCLIGVVESNYLVNNKYGDPAMKLFNGWSKDHWTQYQMNSIELGKLVLSKLSSPPKDLSSELSSPMVDNYVSFVRKPVVIAVQMAELEIHDIDNELINGTQIEKGDLVSIAFHVVEGFIHYYFCPE